ncbi:hypothetical protein CGH73_25820, partial [Vibrio parahaemolyticus]|uniref:hypothetical protein n=1 Tax=Vibrio parahaemolyticus TaxID=670 RepID=UPI00116D0BB5
KYYENLLSCDRDALFFKKIRSAIDIYYNEYNCESLTIESSIRALVQLIRYAPELSKKKDAQVYYDSKLECFGVIYKQTKKKKGTLNIIIKENNEIMFSLARKMTGVIRFTGKAYIGDSLDNSRGIKALFRMMDW